MSRSFYRVYEGARQKDAGRWLWPSRWNLSGYELCLGLWAMRASFGGCLSVSLPPHPGVCASYEVSA